MICKSCGAEIKPGAKFCEYCGTKLEETGSNVESNSSTNAFHKDEGRPVKGYEEKKSSYTPPERPKVTPKEPSAEGPTSTSASMPNFESNGVPQKKKGLSSCCLVSLIVGIIIFVIVMSLIIAAFAFFLKYGDDEASETVVTPTAAAMYTPAASQNNNNVISTALFNNNAVRDHLVSLKGNGEDKVTVMVYMNGSDLETDDKEATTDLAEMIKAGSSDKVDVVVQTMGTKKWHNYNISNKSTQIHEVTANGLKTVKDLKQQLDCTESKTLSDFISWTAQNYPADRYILVFWDHGGGPIYGFGYDQYNEEGMLTIDEMQDALKAAGVYFDFIGMDCCIMSSLEVCCALYDYCDYTVLSEDFEPGLGWAYTGWMKALYKNTSISTPDLAKIIIDDMVQANAAYGSDNDAILALIDQSKLKVLYKAWTDFAYANEAALLGSNYSRPVKARGKIHPKFGMFSDWLQSDDDDSYSLSDYYITDIMAVAQTIKTKETEALSSALDNTLIYVGATEGDKDFTGISVTLPYGDANFYADLKRIFTNCGIDSEYVAWLEKFVGSSNSENFYSYDNWDDSWSGWDDYEDDFNWLDWLFSDDDYGSDEYWDDDYWGWDDWDYDDSWNSWFDNSDYDYDSWDYDNIDWDSMDDYYFDFGFLSDWFW